MNRRYLAWTCLAFCIVFAHSGCDRGKVSGPAPQATTDSPTPADREAETVADAELATAGVEPVADEEAVADEEPTSEALPAEATKRIALTIDDAPRGDGPFFTGEERAATLLDALDEVDATGAIFFVITASIDRREDGEARLREYVSRGHFLANHTHTHPSLNKSDAETYLAEIDTASEILAGYEGTLPLFRFPYLAEGRDEAQRDAVRAGLEARGLGQGYVTIDNYDWHMVTLVEEAVEAGHAIDMDVLRDTYVELMMDSIRFYEAMGDDVLDTPPTHILLLHENDLAALFIDDLVRALQAEGWTIVPGDEAFAGPLAEHTPDTRFLHQGRVAAVAHESGADRKTLVSPWEDKAALRAEFESRGLLPAASERP